MRIVHISTWLLTLATLAPAGCALPDDGADMAFRTTLVGGDDFHNDDSPDEPTAEMPECIVVTTPPPDPTEGDYEQLPGDDFGLPGDESTTGGTSYGGNDDFGLPTTTDGGEDDRGGEDRSAEDHGDDDRGDDGHPTYEGGDDFGGVPMDPTGAALCPGMDQKVTVHATSLAEAVAKCDRYYGHCCGDACAGWGAEADETCALASDHPLAGGYTDLNPNPGADYVCGCDCMPSITIG